MNLKDIRKDFPILSTEVNGKPLIYLDNAATTQKPKAVIDKLVEYYSKTNANIHRGIHYLSEKATQEYEESKNLTAKFINAKSNKEIIYTRNTTESINLVAYACGLASLKKGDIIISSEMEHHSNIVPWQEITKKTGAILKFIKVKDDFPLDLEDYKSLLKLKPKLAAFTHASNVLATINPVKEMTELAHDAGSLVLIDGAQAAPHMKIDMQSIGCDFYAFSAHKMCGPTGIGVLYGKEKILMEMEPFLFGGDMIKSVNFEKSEWNDLPWKFEAGTSNIADGIAFGEAIKYLNKIGIENITTHVRDLTNYALDKIQKIDGVNVFGVSDNAKERGAVIAFTTDFAHPHDIAQILNEDGIAIRSGNHCAQPLHNKFNVQATSRASFYFYNTKEEVDFFIEKLIGVKKIFS